MIRIDEIYNNTFWPWIEQRLPLTRMFFCDPPGDSRPEALYNFGHDVTELHYIFFHDQEPIHLDIHTGLFNEVLLRNKDITHINCRTAKRKEDQGQKIIITSECDSDFVNTACEKYDWIPLYYFFHGWAALDWYRGYNRTFLIPPPYQRKIQKSFISANRIVGGRRGHRVMLMYHLLTQEIKNAWISFPAVCPAENVSAVDIAAKFGTKVQQKFAAADLPQCFPGETGHPMHSCWLSLFAENATSLAHVITETVYEGRRHHLTEKTFKPICLQMPFVLVSTAGSLQYLKSYGFQTFDSIWDESYDQELNDDLRLVKISQLLKKLDDLSPKELQQLYRAAQPMIQHNYQHFYGGGFESILWTELQNMLESAKSLCQG